MSDLDRHAAGAEARLDRLDAEAAGAPPDDERGTVAEDEFGFHVDDPDGELFEDELRPGVPDDSALEALEQLAEAFNARDLDGVLEVVARDGEAPGLLGWDRDNLPDAVEDLWTRRPSALLTRGSTTEGDVGVLWEHDGAQWWRLAVVHVADVQEGCVGVLEFSEDTALLEQVECEVPDGEFEEGARWSEWSEGADADDPTST
ncbi:hypothetical protein [Egicoccus halophilus]|uniref:Uncharacterized protein n=1 Tax=Egicoccus halophilus TaxID=1670830 RepID=A0A8J3ABR6_9ACTN|nr:hypothetical protein [Egicoccus halophilus]GGI02638.1 hypothetical protein GCM10011354_01040 [Egicoccus halophilus]